MGLHDQKDMGLVEKTLDQLWSSFYIGSRSIEGYHVQNVENNPQVRLVRLTEEMLRIHTEKNEHASEKKKLISRADGIDSESEDSNSSLENEIFLVSDNEDDFLPDISLTPQKQLIPSIKNEYKSTSSSIQNKSFTSEVDHRPKAIQSLVYIVSQKPEFDGKALQSDKQAKSGNSEISSTSTSAQEFSKNNSAKKSSHIVPNSEKEISSSGKTSVVLPSTDHHESELQPNSKKTQIESVTKNENSARKIKNLNKNNFKEKSVKTVGDKIRIEKEETRKRKMEFELSKIPQEEISKYVSCDGLSPTKKILLGQISKSTQTELDKIEPEEGDKFPLLSKPTVNIINTEFENVDLKVVDMSTVEGIKHISNTVLNVVQNLKNHKEELENERDLELENLKKKYSTKFQEVDEKIKEFSKLDDKLFNEIREMRLNNSVCNKSVKQEIEQLFEKLNISGNKTEVSLQGSIVEKQNCSNEENRDARRINQKLDSLQQAKQIPTNQKNLFDPPKENTLLSQLLKSSPRTQPDINEGSMFGAFSTSSKISSPELPSRTNQINSEEKSDFHAPPNGNNTSVSSRILLQSPQSSSPRQHDINPGSVSGGFSTSFKVPSPELLRSSTISKHSDRTAEQNKSKPAIRTIAEANFHRFGSSVTKGNSDQNVIRGSNHNQANSPSNSALTLSSPSVSWTTSSTIANSSTLTYQPPSNAIISTNRAVSQPKNVPSEVSVITSVPSPNLNIKRSNDQLVTENSGYHQLPVKPVSTQTSNKTPLGSQSVQSNQHLLSLINYHTKNLEQQQSQQQNHQQTLPKSQNSSQVKIPQQVMSQQNHQQTLPKSQNSSQVKLPQQVMSQQTNLQQNLSQQQNSQQIMPKPLYPQKYLPQMENMQLYPQQQNQQRMQMQFSSPQPQQKQHFQQFQQPAQQNSLNLHPVSSANTLSFYNNYNNNNFNNNNNNNNNNKNNNILQNSVITPHQQVHPIAERTTGFSEQHPHLVPSTNLPTYQRSLLDIRNNRSQTTGYQPYLQQQQHFNQHLQQPTHLPQQQQSLRQPFIHSQQQFNQPIQQPTQDIFAAPHRQRQNIQRLQGNTVGVMNEPPSLMPMITNTESLAPASSNSGRVDVLDQTCFLCGLPAKVLCCGSYVYCSTVCQNEDFERHKQECQKLAS